MSFVDAVAELLLAKCWVSASPEFDNSPPWDIIVKGKYTQLKAEGAKPETQSYWI